MIILGLLIFLCKGYVTQIEENCLYHLGLRIFNSLPTVSTTQTIFVDLRVSDLTGKTDCTDFTLLDDSLQRINFFLEGTCSSQRTTNRMWFIVSSPIQPSSEVEYHLYFGCQKKNDFENTFDHDWILMSSVPCPSSFTRFSQMDNNLLRISNSFGISNHNPEHFHTVNSGLSEFPPLPHQSSIADSSSKDVSLSVNGHKHVVDTFNSNSESTFPPYIKTFFCSSKHLDIFTGSLILTSDDTISSGLETAWKIHDGSKGKFFYGSDTNIGSYGGSSDHVHRVVGTTRTTITEVNDTKGSDYECTYNRHNHDFDGGSGVSNEDLRPPFMKYNVWESLSNNNPLESQLFLSNGANAPIGFFQYSKGNDYFVLAANESGSFEVTGGSFNTLHDHNIQIFSFPSTNKRGVTNGGSGNHPLAIHQHELKLTSNSAVKPLPPHVNLTVFKRIQVSTALQISLGDETQLTLNIDIYTLIGIISGISTAVIIIIVIIVIIICILVALCYWLLKKTKSGADMRVHQSEMIENVLEGGKAFKQKMLKNFMVDRVNIGLGEASKEPKVILHENFKEIRVEDVVLTNYLGRGGYCEVFQCTWKATVCAFKVYKTSYALEEEEKNFEEFEKEVEILGSIQHPNIIQHYGWILTGPRIGILLEMCEFGELGYYIAKKSKENERVPIGEKLRMCLEVSEGMRYLHSKGIIHRDIKLANLLVSKGVTVKIIDFGLAKIFKEKLVSEKQTTRVGTSNYMAPEVLTGKYDSKCDVFSFSIVMFEVFTENFDPYKGRKKGGVVELMVANDESFRPIIPKNSQSIMPDEIVKLIRMCWKHEPFERPHFEMITEKLRAIMLDEKLK